MNNQTQTSSTSSLDPQVVALAKSIRKVESGGNFNAEGKSGEYGAYQYTEPTWNERSKKYGVNVPLRSATPEQQNEVQYKWMKEKKDQGYNIGQIASMHNAGEGRPDAYKEDFKGTNKYGVSYDVRTYATKVATEYQKIKNGDIQQSQPNQNGYQTEASFVNKPNQGSPVVNPDDGEGLASKLSGRANDASQALSKTASGEINPMSGS